MRRGAQLVIATPGRLEDFLNRGLVRLNAVKVLVLDEADRMLDMGFLPAIERILSVLPTERQSLFFSATMKKDVERLIACHSKDPVRMFVDGSKMTTPDQIDLHVYDRGEPREAWVAASHARPERGIISGVRANEARDRSTGETALATGTASGSDARLTGYGTSGIKRSRDFAMVDTGSWWRLMLQLGASAWIAWAHVVNYDLPQAPTDFIHYVGRTGRAGQRGAASTFSMKSERAEVRRIELECKVLLERRKVAAEIVQEANESAEPKIHTDSAAPNKHVHRSFPRGRGGKQNAETRPARGRRQG